MNVVEQKIMSKIVVLLVNINLLLINKTFLKNMIFS